MRLSCSHPDSGNKAIAARMDLTEQTVERYLYEVRTVLYILQRPDVNKRAWAVLVWLRDTGALPQPYVPGKLTVFLGGP
jgi:hypothetical protein